MRRQNKFLIEGLCCILIQHQFTIFRKKIVFCLDYNEYS